MGRGGLDKFFSKVTTRSSIVSLTDKQRSLQANYSDDYLSALKDGWTPQLIEFFKKNGPYLYHLTTDDNLASIIDSGLKPSGEISVDKKVFSDESVWRARQDCLYLATQKGLKSVYLPDFNPIKVHVKDLLPGLVFPDEDIYYSETLLIGEKDKPQLLNSEDYGIPSPLTSVKDPDGDWVPGEDRPFESYGEWAETYANRIGKSKEECEKSIIDFGLIAYRGSIQPQALNVLSGREKQLLEATTREIIY